MAAPKHVFISHSSQDNAIGLRVCGALEKLGIRCWYSSRVSDLQPGSEWDDNIVAALDTSVAVVLIFSSKANASKWVKRELVMAGHRDIPIYPIRIENVRPAGGMEAHLASVQWTDAFNGPIESYLGPIIDKLRSAFPLRTADEQPPVVVASSHPKAEERAAPELSEIDALAELSTSQSELNDQLNRLVPFPEMPNAEQMRSVRRSPARQSKPSPASSYSDSSHASIAAGIPLVSSYFWIVAALGIALLLFLGVKW